MDIIGTESIYAEADLMASIATMLRKFGLKDGEFAIGVSSRKLLATYLEEIGAPNPALVYPVLDRRLKIGPEAFAKALAEAGLTEDQVKKLDDFMSCKSIEEVRAAVKSENATAALAEIEDLFATLSAAGYGECVNLDLSIVRGLAYYTGIVFEVFDKGKSMRAIAGGGRYDSLTEKLGGERIPGVGFGMGDVVLADLLAEHNLLPSPKQSVDFYIASFVPRREVRQLLRKPPARPHEDGQAARPGELPGRKDRGVRGRFQGRRRRIRIQGHARGRNARGQPRRNR